MLIPYRADVVMRRWPVANWCLIAVTVLVFAWQYVANEHTLRAMVLNREEFAWSQLVTKDFVHAGPGHLIGNMIFLFVFGNAVNAKLGHGKFLVAYFVSGAVAGLAWLALGVGKYALGASGSIMGIVGLFAAFYPRNEVSVFWALFLWYWGRVGVSSIWVILIYLALDLLGVLVGGRGVAYISHVAGLLFGFGVGCALLATRLVTSEPDEENILQTVGIQS